MTIFSILSLLCRAIGLKNWAEDLWERHEERLSRNAATKVDRLSDADVTDRLLKNYKRDD